MKGFWAQVREFIGMDRSGTQGLGGVDYIESLGVLVSAMKRTREAGGDLRLCARRGDVLRIFEVTWLNRAMLVYPSRQEAVASWT